MYKIFDLTNPRSNYQKKIKKKYQNLLKEIHSELYYLNPILSGSCAIMLIFKPDCVTNDYDFYFNTKNHFKKTELFFIENNFKLKMKTKNCVVFENKTNQKDIQLINRFYGNIKEIVSSHDFVNSAIGIQNNQLVIHNEVLNLFKYNQLKIMNLQIDSNYYLNPNFSLNEIGLVISYVVNLLSRIKKYLNRYKLKIDNSTLKIMAPFVNYFKKIKKDSLLKNKELFFHQNVYYGTYTKAYAYKYYLTQFFKLNNLEYKFQINYFDKKKYLITI